MTAPTHFDQFADNLSEVARLAGIHSQLTGNSPGRRRDVDILNKSGIVLVVACWESFVEDLASLAFDFMLKEAKVPTVFPSRVLTLAAKSRREAPDERKVWELAGEGWREVLTEHRKQVLDSFLGGFHTPRPAKVDTLFEELVGLAGLSAQWHWQKNYNQDVIKRLNALVTLRGHIAHRVSVGRYVRKSEVESAVDTVRAIAAITSNRVRTHLKARTAVDPWVATAYGSAQ